MNRTILIIDDEKPQRESLGGYFRKRGFEVTLAANGKEGIETVKEKTIDLVLTDYRMPDMTGQEVLTALKKINPEIVVILMTAYGTIETAVEAMKEGAFYYLQKPVNLDELDILIGRSLMQKQLIGENKKLKEELAGRFRFESIISQSRELEESLNIAGRVAKSSAPVLIRGESGTGKELFAKAIHYASDRKDEPFVVVNCAALPETLLESEMFGYEKGAFTGADQRRIGRFEEAMEGTIFIDEVGDIPLLTQVKLLRVLQSGEFSRLGSNQVQKTRARIITATNRGLEELIREKKFREDFYYRINVVSIQIPPLRERRADIPLLADHFIRKFCPQVKQVSNEAMDLMLKYDYPGNVRELENIIQRACVLSRGEVITTYDLPVTMKPAVTEKQPGGAFAPHVGDLNEQTEALEKEIIEMALKETGGNQSKAARLLNISERNLRYKLMKMQNGISAG
ncbi:MAG: sigma-54-dependent Fis family transcriptional regulator [Ignavibacteria bacterium]|jgi:two-component system NtrC family response regulator|nr:sigma-54-dependent Fis family transcriptional regulator [Ignavibacteria bacterium]MCU7520730.1 sigma-54-dependent Fis family transcriptional regulator [Ignavibacteria bacterium]